LPSNCTTELLGSDVKIFVERGEVGLPTDNSGSPKLLKSREHFWSVEGGEDCVPCCSLEYLGCPVPWFGMGMGLDTCPAGGDMSSYTVAFASCFRMLVFSYKASKFAFCWSGLMSPVEELNLLMSTLDEYPLSTSVEDVRSLSTDRQEKDVPLLLPVENSSDEYKRTGVS